MPLILAPADYTRWLSDEPDPGDLTKQRLPSLASLPSFCTECGSKAPNSNGHQRRLLISLHKGRNPRRPAGANVPAGTLALVRSPLALRCSKEQSALHTLIRQRHLTPSCGGARPTAERTMDPARIFTESLTPRPELENGLGESREGISPPRAPKTVREPLDLHGFRCSASDIH